MATRRQQQQREAITHRLKSWPDSFRAVSSGRKRFEIRRDDRNFQPGDIVELLEFDPEYINIDGETQPRQRGFTGNRAMFFVGYVERSTAIPPGWCGFQLVSAAEINRASLAMGFVP